jgi:hypothetical protein
MNLKIKVNKIEKIVIKLINLKKYDIKNFKLLTLDSNNIKFKKTNFLCDDKTNY